MKTVFAALLGLSVAFSLGGAPARAEETTEQKVERLKHQGKEYLEQMGKQIAEATEKLKAEMAEIQSKYDTKEKRQAAIEDAKKRFAETKERIEKAHEEQCVKARPECTALYPDSKMKYQACIVWNGCLR
jgi:Skp family chaperone for outer membrane proteins